MNREPGNSRKDTVLIYLPDGSNIPICPVTLKAWGSLSPYAAQVKIVSPLFWEREKCVNQQWGLKFRLSFAMCKNALPVFIFFFKLTTIELEANLSF